MFIVFDLSPEAIAALNALAEKEGLTRSEIVEHQIGLLNLADPAPTVFPVFHEQASEASLLTDFQRTINRWR